jgi:hypothetical protein
VASSKPGPDEEMVANWAEQDEERTRIKLDNHRPIQVDSGRINHHGQRLELAHAGHPKGTATSFRFQALAIPT